MLENERVQFIFADSRELYDDALEMLAQERLRNAADKAWAATKRATDALILARTGDEPRTSGQDGAYATAIARGGPDFGATALAVRRSPILPSWSGLL